MTSSAPVTVSITRHVDPAHRDEMLAWIRAGGALAVRFPGFLGTGWVRPGPDSDEWHMLYRFADADSLAGWEASSQRRWWLGAAQGIVGESRVERRTGIEGWFDEPLTHDVEDLRPGPVAPPRWKQACVIFLVFFPLSVVVNAVASRWLLGLWLPLRVLVTVLVMTPGDDLRRVAVDHPADGVVAARPRGAVVPRPTTLTRHYFRADPAPLPRRPVTTSRELGRVSQ